MNTRDFTIRVIWGEETADDFFNKNKGALGRI